MSQEKDWVDFREIKLTISIEMILEHYGINWLRKNSDELRGKCPIHKGDGDRCFHVNVVKNNFNCFSCNARGNILDFVSAMEGVSIREAALKLKDWFGVGESGKVESSSAGRREKIAGAKNNFTVDHNTTSVAEVNAKQNSAGPILEAKPKVEINPTLSFKLNIDPLHHYAEFRGIAPDTVQFFGAGLCLSKGMFANRFLVPLHNPNGSLVGYAGRSITEQEPKYLFPSSDKGFYKSHLLFNFHRVLENWQKKTPLVIVEGFFDTMKIHQAGFPLVVGLLGCSLSEFQQALIIEHFSHAILMLDGDEPGQKASSAIADKLTKHIFVRVINLPNDTQPDSLSSSEIAHILNPIIQICK